MPHRLTSPDPIAAAYYAARAAFHEVAAPAEWTEESKAARTAAGLACREAVAALKEAADPGNPEIWHAMAHLSQSPFMFRTPEEALEEMRVRRAQGERQYWRPAPVPEEVADADRALREAAGESWERKAAEAGLPAAMVSLAWVLQREAARSPEAIKWLERAAAMNCARAMVSLGFAFRDGRGVPQDFPAAAGWFRRAVEAGDSHALVLLGRLLAHEMNRHEEGVSILLQAAAAGHRDAFIYLADLYADRHSPVHDAEEALRWYHRVAELNGGSACRAMLELSNRYRDGIGTTAERATARQWLSRHAEALPGDARSRKEAERKLKQFDESLV